MCLRCGGPVELLWTVMCSLDLRFGSAKWSVCLLYVSPVLRGVELTQKIVIIIRNYPFFYVRSMLIAPTLGVPQLSLKRLAIARVAANRTSAVQL